MVGFSYTGYTKYIGIYRAHGLIPLEIRQNAVWEESPSTIIVILD